MILRIEIILLAVYYENKNIILLSKKFKNSKMILLKIFSVKELFLTVITVSNFEN